MKLAKADIVPKDINLREGHASFAEVEAACQAFMDQVNNREHRVVPRRPAVMLVEEQSRLHRIRDTAHTVAFGVSRSVPGNTPMVTFENGQYSVPVHLVGARVFVRPDGAGPDEQVIVVHHGVDGPVEVARHARTRSGSPAIDDAHFPGHTPKIPGDYLLVPRSKAAAVGTARMNLKMAEAFTSQR